MARGMFLGSLVVCALSAGVSQIPDPGILGIRDEPSIILFYAGTGLLAAFAALLAAGSGAYLAITRVVALSDGQRRFLLTASLVLLSAIIIVAVIRFVPR